MTPEPKAVAAAIVKAAEILKKRFNNLGASEVAALAADVVLAVLGEL